MGLGRTLRTVLFTAMALALWSFARPALAAPAPFCDDRGATALAEPPALDAPDEAIAKARACATTGGDLSYFAMIGRARHRAAWSLHGASTAVPTHATPIFEPSSEELPRIASASERALGVRGRVDRPPRPSGR